MLKPLFDKVIVKMEDSQEITKGGIILSGSSKDKPHIAVVVEVGPGINNSEENVEMCVKKGDRVVLNKYTGTELDLDDEEYIIVKQADILAVVE